MKTADIRFLFQQEFKQGRFVTDRSGQKTLEILGASFVADEPAIVGQPNMDYIRKELAWYATQSLNINDMPDPPEQWRRTAGKHGEINSNYGYLLYHESNGAQYHHVYDELSRNPDSRRACAIYTRPTMWQDYQRGGCNDFICTNAVTYYVRDGKVHAVVQMRSNDAVYGYKNDRAWQQTVLFRLARDLGMSAGTLHWQVQNLHIYERHFTLL